MSSALRAKKQKSASVSFFHDARIRSIIAQVLVVGLLLVSAVYFTYNVVTNLQKSGITTGFGFLAEPSGFDISQTLIDYSSKSTYLDAMLVGLLNTLLVSALGIVFSTFLGFLLAILRLSPNWLVSKMSSAYTEIIRNIPLLLQILFWYLAILTPLPGPRQAMSVMDVLFLCNRGVAMPRPVFAEGSVFFFISIAVALIVSCILLSINKKRQQRTGQRFPAMLVSLVLFVGLPGLTLWATGFPIAWDIPVLKGFNFRGGITVLPELIALLLALTLYTATFISEYIRSGIMSVDKGQQEAAQALGYRPWMIYRLIIIPQALRVAIPPLISQYLTLIKNSSLAVVIGYPELVHVFAGTALNQSGQAIEIISITMAIYLAISLLISGILNLYNKKVVLRGSL
ncbi:MAG: amino acid ABC transporter permease [Deltaproteobacteria bacterium]|nr:MAG: amino acid ABC transporter permease [Deltaproteobacteria bacterium]